MEKVNKTRPRSCACSRPSKRNLASPGMDLPRANVPWVTPESIDYAAKDFVSRAVGKFDAGEGKPFVPNTATGLAYDRVHMFGGWANWAPSGKTVDRTPEEKAADDMWFRKVIDLLGEKDYYIFGGPTWPDGEQPISVIRKSDRSHRSRPGCTCAPRR